MGRYPHLVLHRRRWMVRLIVPIDVRPVIGQSIFKISTGETDESAGAERGGGVRKTDSGSKGHWKQSQGDGGDPASYDGGPRHGQRRVRHGPRFRDKRHSQLPSAREAPVE